MLGDLSNAYKQTVDEMQLFSGTKVRKEKIYDNYHMTTIIKLKRFDKPRRGPENLCNLSVIIYIVGQVVNEVE